MTLRTVETRTKIVTINSKQKRPKHTVFVLAKSTRASVEGARLTGDSCRRFLLFYAFTVVRRLATAALRSRFRCYYFGFFGSIKLINNRPYSVRVSWWYYKCYLCLCGVIRADVRMSDIIITQLLLSACAFFCW